MLSASGRSAEGHLVRRRSGSQGDTHGQASRTPSVYVFFWRARHCGPLRNVLYIISATHTRTYDSKDREPQSSHYRRKGSLTHDSRVLGGSLLRRQ